MVIYNLIKGSYLFSIAWFIATILASTYVLIRINTVFATYISTDRMNLFMKNWNNDFLPYDYDNKVKILSEFIPAKTKIVEIPLNEISTVLILIRTYVDANAVAKNHAIENKNCPLKIIYHHYKCKTRKQTQYCNNHYIGFSVT